MFHVQQKIGRETAKGENEEAEPIDIDIYWDCELEKP